MWCTKEDLELIRKDEKDSFRKPWDDYHNLKVGQIQMLQTEPHQSKSECKHFIKVLGLFKQRLGDMTPYDCFRQGIDEPDCNKFKKKWNKDLPRRKKEDWSWKDDLEVVGIEFEYLHRKDIKSF